LKSFSADLTALLAAGLPLYKADLFMIGPTDNGQMIYATNGQQAIRFGGNLYQPQQFGAWSRDTVVTKIGLDSNSTKLTVFADNQIPIYFPGTSNGALLLDGIKYGLLGDSPVTIYTAYMPTYGQVTGGTSGSLVETKFVGMVTNIEYIGLTKAVINIQDLLYLLNIQVPSRLFQASCSHTLYDTGCTIVKSTRTRTGAVGTLLTPNKFFSSAHITPVTASGTFTQGILTWTSGKNSGLASYVTLWASGLGTGGTDIFTLAVQTIFPIALTDGFTITQGCDKQFVTCIDLQGSSALALQNFGGEPDTPVPETAI
jgi:hypothetical protein